MHSMMWNLPNNIHIIIWKSCLIHFLHISGMCLFFYLCRKLLVFGCNWGSNFWEGYHETGHASWTIIHQRLCWDISLQGDYTCLVIHYLFERIKIFPLFAFVSILFSTVCNISYSFGDLGNGLMLLLMTNFRLLMTNYFLCVQKRLMNFGLPYWRKHMQSGYHVVLFMIYQQLNYWFVLHAILHWFA